MNYYVKKQLLLILLILESIDFCHGQIDPPKIIQPSPSASGLFKFQDYPVDYSTGLAQINIPIYTVTSGSLSVPISLNYHAAGRKVYDQDGPIALDWSLNAGGMISRAIHGTADFGNYKFPYPFKIDNVFNYGDLAYLQRIMRYQGNSYCGTLFPFYDSEYDIFSYSFPGGNGKFIFKDNNNVKTPVVLPYKPIIVTPNITGPNQLTIDINDEKGINYKFIPTEFAQIDEYAPTGWNLDKIISADKTDTIFFTYLGAAETRKTINQVITLKDDWIMPGFGNEVPPSPNPGFTENTTQVNYQISRLSEIKFRQGKVKFNLLTGNLRVNSIQIINTNNEVIKTIQLNRASSYFQAETGNTTNTLSSLEFKDKLSAIVEKYSFEYYHVINSDVNGPVNVRYCDWWGYYNNSGQHDMLPKYTVSAIGWQLTYDIGNPSGNRQPNLEAAKSAVLKKIIYPTGGSTEFIYERNRCKINGGDGSIKYGPGLRIQEIKTSDFNGNTQYQTFKYGNKENDYGYLELFPDVSTIMSTTSFYSLSGTSWLPMELNDGKYRERNFYSDIYEELSELASRPVRYFEVTEYKGSQVFNSGKTIYSYDYTPWAASGFYPKKNIYSYNYWDNASLVLQSDYKRLGNIYQKTRSSGNTYISTATESIRGLHVQRAYATVQDGYGLSTTPLSATMQAVCSEQYIAYNSGFIWGQRVPVYSSNAYQVVAGYKNLAEKNDTLFTDAGNLITKTSYAYNSKNLISNSTTTSSKGEILSTDIKYPFDYMTNPDLTQMLNLNMLNYPIEQIEKKGIALTKSTKTNYINWGTTLPMMAPQTTEIKTGNNNYETRLRFSSYDKDGNPLIVSREKDKLVSYVWGYNNSYPIAEVVNTAVKNIFYTSFEDGLGNSTINDAKTGKLSKTDGFSKPLSNLDKGVYRLSYWKKSGSVWGLQASDITVSTGIYTITLTGQVDEIRFYPKNSEMKTFTYEPLIGILTECDASDHVSYYEYDSYGSLKLVRDMNGNILKTFKYQYQSSTAN